MKIRSKLIMSFVIITILMSIVAAVTLVQNRNTKTSATEDLYSVVQNLDYAWFLIESLQNQDLAAKGYILFGEDELKDDYFEEKGHSQTYYSVYYPGANEYVKPLLVEYDENVQQYHIAIEEAFSLYETGADEMLISEQLVKAEEFMETARESGLYPIRQFIHAEQLEPAKQDIESDIDSTTLAISIASALAVLFIIAIGFYISWAIADPITRLKSATIELGKGNLDTSIAVKSKDEIGDLAKSFNQMVQDLKKTTASRDELEAEVAHRKQAQEALQREKQNLQNILNNSGDGIIIIDHQEMVRFVNPASKMLFGDAAEDLLGNLFGLPVVAGERAEVDIIRENGETGTGEMRVEQTDWEGEVAYIASIRDITDRKQIEDELRWSKTELQRTLDDLRDSED